MMTANEAKKLCTSAEYELVRQSASTSIGSLSESQLRAAVQRTRKLRDKQRDLAARQRREGRGKAGPRGSRPSKPDNNNTLRKLELFEEVLERFTTRLEKVGGPIAGPATRPKKKTAGTRVRTTTKSDRRAATAAAIEAKKKARAKSRAPAKKATAKKLSKKVAKKKAIKKKASATKVSKKTSKKSSTKAAARGSSGRLASASGGTGSAPKSKRKRASATRLLASAGGASRGSAPVRQSTAAFMTPEVRATTTALLAESGRSRISRLRNIYANTANARIRGHVSGQGRRKQGKRDAVQRTGRVRPSDV